MNACLPPVVLREPLYPIDPTDVTTTTSSTSSFKIPASAVLSKIMEDEKPKRCLTAYNLFFRDQRQQLLEALPVREGGKPKYSHGKISFKGLARVVSANWKVTTPQERNYYQSLAAADKLRYKKEMKEWKEKIEQQQAAQAQEQQQQQAEALAMMTDLPFSLASIFDEDEPLVGIPPTAMTTTSTAAAMTFTTTQNGMDQATVVSVDEEQPQARPVVGRAQLEKVFGSFPTTLLGSVHAADHEWPV